MTPRNTWRTVWSSPNERLIVQAQPEEGWTRHRFISNSEGNGAVVLAVHEGRVLFIHAQRPVLDTALWELPRGQADKIDKSPEDTARREFEEETGLRPVALKTLGQIYPDSGLCGDAVNVVVTTVGTRNEAIQAEYQRLVWLSPKEIRESIVDGRIRDGISLSAILLAQSTGLILS